MKSKSWKISLLYASIMGILTMFLSLAVADGVFGLNQPPARVSRELVGVLFFWSGMIALPLLFYKRVKWRYTLLNILLYFLLYFPIYEIFGLKHTHFFLETGGFIVFPSYWGAILVAVLFWGIQSIVFLIFSSFYYILQKKDR